jgi:ABC-2 type transport system ATP-binding protein
VPAPAPASGRGGAQPPDHNGGTHAIDAQSLTRDFGGFRAVDRASFIVRYGEIFG